MTYVKCFLCLRGGENMHEEKLKQQIEILENLQQKINTCKVDELSVYEVEEMIKLASLIIDLANRYDVMYGD